MTRVVVLGAGFGGLQCARTLAGEPVDVTIVDRNNFHLFTPLLYQVASCLLAPAEIVAPLRKVFRGSPNVHVHVGAVVNVDLAERTVALDDGTHLPYDHLVVSTGSVTNYFGNAAIAAHALPLKDLPDALALRNHVLDTLERAAHANPKEFAEGFPDERGPLLTFCIVGGGPTGVEYAGALAELVRLVLPREYPELRDAPVRIVLLEMADRVLATFHPSLSAYARRELERLGVEVLVGASVESLDGDGVDLRDGSRIDARTVVWTAGVRPADLATPAPLERNERGRLVVDQRLRVVGHPEVYAIGDIAAATDASGRVLPQVSPPAMQAGRFVAREIVGQHAGGRAVGGRAGRPFRYRDKGNLATIGRRRAVAEIGPLRFRGLLGWVTWLVVHLWYLIGFENRLVVMMRWSWYYLRYERPIRARIPPVKPPTGAD